MRLSLRSLTVVFTLAAFCAPLGAALAGTTGTIEGEVVSSSGLPLAGVTVRLVSPSQSARTTTDASGHFAVLSLEPDTYGVSATKHAYAPTDLTGISVSADQVQTLRIVMRPSLKTIANVTSRSSMDVVKPGTTVDVYSVNATVTKAVAGVGGGGGLNNAYSAIATVPGVYVPPNQQGWNQTVYIRGGAYDQIGYEYDGVPVNRSFDNYPGGTAGTLGQQELQVYAGGGTAGQSSSGLAGFINQVIKTGTYPGYANVTAGLGAPAYYHTLQIEAGGATPDRLFSYYVGIGGYNQDFRYLDQFNGASLGNTWGYSVIADNTSNLINFPGVYPTCSSTPPTGSGLYDGPNPSPVYDPFTYAPGQKGGLTLPKGVAYDPGCYQTISPAYSSYSNLADRENVINLHFGIPHRHDSGRDDIQVLYNGTSLISQFYSSANDIGPNLVYQLNQLRGSNEPEVWGDFVTWRPGTYFGQPATGATAIPYFMPSSPGNRCANVAPATIDSADGSKSVTLNIPGACAPGTYAQIPLTTRDGFANNAGIVKVQYQHNIGSSAYLRFYGYSFYSDWLQTGPLSYASGLYGLGVLSYDYELESHTRGLALSFADQFDAKNLLTFDANYTTATTNRYNNDNFNNSLTSSATSLTNGTTCYSFATGAPAPCNDPSTSGSFIDPTNATYCSISPGACISKLPAGASWRVTYTGNSGFVNNVVPKFTALALQDELRPNDALDLTLGVRDEIYAYQLANTSDNGQNFWFAAGQHEFCYNPQTLQPYVIPAPPASGLPDTPFIGFTCPVDTSIPAHPVQTVHPDGLDGHLLLSNTYSSSLSDNAFTPRLGLTYTLNPDTVLRFSAGRFAQEPETYQVQYNAKDNNLAYDLFQAFWQYGYTTPRHDPEVQYSTNIDASYERRFKGTDMSIKVSPYYRYATNQIYSIGLPFGLSGGLNTGTERVDGVELSFTKGDFNKNGLSFLLSYTYLNAAEKFGNFPGTSINPLDPYNQDIANFNGLTGARGGSKCYENDANGNLYPDPTCTQLNPAYNPPIANPYYAMKPQPLFNRNDWYQVGLDFPYLSPNVLTAVVNYKHGKFAITPALTFNEGERYGNPGSVVGIDPRTCTGNSAGMTGSPIHLTNPDQADYTTCNTADTQNGTSAGTLFIPDPSIGKFDSFGQFQQPSQVNLSLSLSYDLSPRVTVTGILSNLFNGCFGGSSTPWSKEYPPNAYTCGYVGNSYYISNFYNGTSPNDRAANGVALNPAFENPYIPAWADSNSLVIPGPFNAYVQVNVKI